MAFSDKELQIIKWGRENGRTREQVEGSLTRFRTGIGPKPQPVVEKIGVIPETIGDIKETFTGAVEDVTRGIETAEQVRERVERGETTPLAGTLQTIGAGLRAGAGVVGQAVLGVGKALLPQRAEGRVAEVVGAGVESILERDFTQEAIQRFQELPEETRRNVVAVGGVIEGLGTAFGFGPVVSKFRTTISDIAQRSLRASDDVFTKARQAVPSFEGVNIQRVNEAIKDVRLKISDVDPQVETILKRSNFDEVNNYFQRARVAKADPAKGTPLELAGNKAEGAFDLISGARTKAIQGKKSILDAVATQRVSGNVINDVFAGGAKNMDERFGARIDTKGNVTQSTGRTLTLDKADQKLVNEYFGRLNTLGVSPTVRQVDDFVDWAQGQLYKQSKTLSTLEAAGKPVVGELKRMTGDLNTRLKTAVGGGYGEVNARIARLIELQDELSRALGADARKGGGLIKSLFSPTGGNTRRIFEEIRQETGIDLFKEATLARFAMDTVGDVRQKSLLKQLDVGVQAAAEIDLTKPASIVRWLRERADLDGQQLANELIKKFGKEITD